MRTSLMSRYSRQTYYGEELAFPGSGGIREREAGILVGDHGGG